MDDDNIVGQAAFYLRAGADPAWVLGAIAYWTGAGPNPGPPR